MGNQRADPARPPAKRTANEQKSGSQRYGRCITLGFEDGLAWVRGTNEVLLLSYIFCYETADLAMEPESV